jgi:hypothetical protein
LTAAGTVIIGTPRQIQFGLKLAFSRKMNQYRDRQEASGRDTDSNQIE